ncbi:tRNA (uracil-5-)-methyltransferase homolog B-like isoform X2 [Haemaphysalis longicornis]
MVEGYCNQDEFSVCQGPRASSWGASPEENCRGRRQACWSTLSMAQGVPAASPPSSSRPGISIAHYQVGRTEMLLLELRGQFCADDLCAIVNVGQAGLSARAIRVLCEYGRMKRLVCVPCQPELCSNVPQAGKVGAPFRLLLACPVDMFPWTRHCELRLLFGH